MSEENRLSQAEIEALLNSGLETPATPTEGDGETPWLSDAERGTLCEIGNLSFGSAAATFSALLQQSVELTDPNVQLLPATQLQQVHADAPVWASVQFTSGLDGVCVLAFSGQDARTVADLMLGGNGVSVASELNELHLSALAEAMNQVVGTAVTTLSSLFQRPIRVEPPRVAEVDVATDPLVEQLGSFFVQLTYVFRVGTLIESTVRQLLPLTLAREMLQSGPNAQADAASTDQPSDPVPAVTSTSTAATLAPAAPVDNPAATSGGTGMVVDLGEHARQSVRTVQRPEFQDFQPVARERVSAGNLSMLFDVPLNVTVELGRTRKSIKEVLELTTGSILELDKLAGEPVDIYVNQKRVALGEVVVIDENFGVRVTDIISPAERMHNLQ